jgi:FixJ family two-component response regulator
LVSIVQSLNIFAFVPQWEANVAKAVMISIIDDDDSVRVATKLLIQSLGYAVATFASAEHYLRSDNIHNTSCLITDVQLPGMNGVELQEQLTADGLEIPVIFMTAFSMESVRARALKSGAFGFLSKPFRDDCLVKCLDKALAR